MDNIILKKGCFNEDIFQLDNGRDDGNHGYFSLKQKMKRYDINVTTINKNSILNLFFDLQDKIDLFNNNYLIIREPSCVLPGNHNKKNYKKFKKVFTRNDDLVDNKKIFKLNFSQKLPEEKIINTGEKFCCLISGNKFSFHKNELYSERRKAVDFFEKKYPGKFDLFGARWNRFFYPFKTNFSVLLKKDFKIWKIFQYLYIVLFKNKYKVYKGMVDVKLDTLSKYKFLICYENQRGYNGYITEKIRDSLFARCIPIYLGCENIYDYVPENCFIDKRKYKNYDELYNYLVGLTDEDIDNYKKNIDEFLLSEKAKNFYVDKWVDILSKHILEDVS